MSDGKVLRAVLLIAVKRNFARMARELAGGSYAADRGN